MSSNSKILKYFRKKLHTLVWSFFIFNCCHQAAVSETVVSAAEPLSFPVNLAGIATTRKQGANAFSQPSANMSFERRLDFSVGNSFFRNPWVIAPASTTARDGLGPLFNTNGCQNCHIKDGRGHLPQSDQDNVVSALVRVSLYPTNEAEWQHTRIHGVIPEPNYGTQIQDFSVADIKPEARVVIQFDVSHVELSDGKKVELVKPVVVLKGLNYGPLDKQAKLSLRIAPPMIGLGLLEAIPEETLIRFSDPDDQNNDGISGRPNRVMDVLSHQAAVGRFGWKSEQPSLQQQNAAAFLGDIGITSHLFSEEACQSGQVECLKVPNGGSPELSENILDKVTFYSRNLAVPKRRNTTNTEVLAGEGLFVSSGCHQCHRTNILTMKLDDQPEQSEIKIHPFTDMLLHDMGEGLSDGRPVFEASGREWRTAPLWGIGLTKAVSGHEYYLHDGRARSLLEAILWHGGEAEMSKQKVVAMSSADRKALIAFLKTL